MVEIDPLTKIPLRIFKYPAKALFLPPERVAEWPRIEAERSIKKQLLQLQEDCCKYCGKIANMSSHLHEKLHRSKGGEVSLENSVVICAKCHTGPKGEHSKRAPQWSKNES
jgi:5-methylcytosine-specific restriction endonuclease McrA